MFLNFQKKLTYFVEQWPLVSLIFTSLFAHLIFVLVLGVQPHHHADSTDYIRLAERLLSFDFQHYEFEWTPGYPLLIGLSGMNFQLLVFFQFILNLSSVLLLFKVSELLFSRAVSFLISLAPVLIINFYFYEQSVLTETFSLFLFMSIVYLFCVKEHTSRIMFYIGLLCSLLMFTRTMFLYLSPLVALCYVYENRANSLGFIVKRTMLLLGPTIIAFVFWCSVNKHHTGNFSLTPYFGINLAQTTVGFFDRYQGDHMEIKAIYMKHILNYETLEDKHIKNAIWASYDELLLKTGMTLPELSKVLGKMSVELILDNPWLYLKQVGISYTDFWRNDLYWLKHLDNDFLNAGFILWRRAGKGIQLVLNLLFFLATFYYGYLLVFKREKIVRTIVFIILSVQAAALLQAMVIYGDNSRFSFPFYPFITLIAVYFVLDLCKFQKLKRSNT